VHDFDIVRRRVAEEIPDVRVDPGVVVQRVEGGDVLVDAARVGTHPLAVSIGRVPVVNALASARRLRRLRSRSAKGHIAFVATNGNDVLGWIWLSGAALFRDRWIGLKLHFKPGESYVYDLWVYPGFRNSGAAAFLMAEMLHALQGEGDTEWVYGWIDRDNRPNQLLQRMVFGFESVHSVKYIQVLAAFGRVLSRNSSLLHKPRGHVGQPRFYG
jgi:ribosomal protein S18 acetylase RimI-like enzyme